MATHTPGPWVAGLAARNPYPDPPGDKWSIQAAMGWWVADIYPYVRGCQDCSETRANARLIAAAPELLEALKPFANYACDPPCGCHNCKARAAIAKAIDNA